MHEILLRLEEYTGNRPRFQNSSPHIKENIFILRRREHQLPCLSDIKLHITDSKCLLLSNAPLELALRPHQEKRVSEKGILYLGDVRCELGPIKSLTQYIKELGSAEEKIDKIENRIAPDSISRHEPKQQDQELTCRICFDTGRLCDMVSPCDCSGSIQFIHIQCFVKWCRNRFAFVTNDGLEVIRENDVFRCEICHKHYKRKALELILEGSEKASFLYRVKISHTLTKADIGNYIVNWPEGEKLFIGRGDYNHIAIPHSSVSRQHLTLWREPTGQLVLVDTASTYGTSIEIGNEVSFDQEVPDMDWREWFIVGKYRFRLEFRTFPI